MIEKLTSLLNSHKQVTSVAMDNEFFGANKQTQVVLLERTDDLIELHYDVIELLEWGGLTLDDPQFSRKGFLPHATAQKHARLNTGDIVKFYALSIIDSQAKKTKLLAEGEQQQHTA